MNYKHRRKKVKTVKGKRTAVVFMSLISIIVAFALVMGIGGIFSVEDGYEDFDEKNVAPVDKETGKINVLIVGLDHDGMRTDTILIASYDLDDNFINILSIPRDTRMYVGGRYQKINCAYAVKKQGKINGINGTIEAVSRLTAIPINYYIEFTCEAFRETVDALGGVDFDVPRNMNYDDPYQDLHIHLTKGFQHLDGDKAEQLVRFRKYPMGDIDRVKVQQEFLREMANQKLNVSVLSKVPDIFKVIQKNIKTNFTLSDVTKYLLNAADLKSENIQAYSLPGTADGVSYGASFWIANMTELGNLIENTFGYDASNITIHSADGSSISKDVKITPKNETQKKEDKKSSKEDTVSKKETENKTQTKSETKAEEKKTVSPENKKENDSVKKETEQNPDISKEKDNSGIKRPKANTIDE